jgi:hypothetical protein
MARRTIVMSVVYPKLPLSEWQLSTQSCHSQMRSLATQEFGSHLSDGRISGSLEAKPPAYFANTERIGQNLDWFASYFDDRKPDIVAKQVSCELHHPLRSRKGLLNSELPFHGESFYRFFGHGGADSLSDTRRCDWPVHVGH